MMHSTAESFTRDQMTTIQIERLHDTVRTVLSTESPLCERLRLSGVEAGDVTSLDVLPKLPFATKTDLRDNYPFGLFAVPVREVIRIHASSGTRGKPTVVGYTRNDLDVWSHVMARCLVMAGVRPSMIVHNAYGYGLFTGGLGFHGGAEELGCTVIPISGGMTQRQVLILQDLGGQVLCSTPSYALNIAEALEREGVVADSLQLRVGIFGAEPWTEELRDEIERRLCIKAINIYGLSEIVGPGVSCECAEAQNGSHIHEDHFLPEVIDPETGEALSAGENGELVFTTLTKEALPLIRYRTGDIASLDPEPCVCGRTTVRMSRILGRRDDMMIIRGVNLYPSEIERILLRNREIAPHYQILIDRPGTMDELTIMCEADREETDRMVLAREVESALRADTGISMTVHVLPTDGVPRSEGKAVRVIDRRPK